MKQHPKYKHISVTEDGKVFSSLSNKFLSTYINDNGYEITNITTSKGVHERYRVHRLVAETYLDNPDNLTDVNHIDHNKENNHVSNLEWCDRAYNIKYAIEEGFNPSQGQSHSQATYTDEDIIYVCKLLSEGFRNCDIEKITGVQRDTVSKIRYKEVWTHLDEVNNLPTINRKGRISIKKVRLVCELLELGNSNVYIKKETGLSLFTISKIRNRRTYLEVSKDYSF